jgi:hypothetical protein
LTLESRDLLYSSPSYAGASLSSFAIVGGVDDEAVSEERRRFLERHPPLSGVSIETFYDLEVSSTGPSPPKPGKEDSMSQPFLPAF